MLIAKKSIKTNSTIPLIAALPYVITSDDVPDWRFDYDARTQLTQLAGRDFSTCRCDESAGGIFQSKSDTKKDD
jgi:hypothetical protein